jgi:hypothetical protein
MAKLSALVSRTSDVTGMPVETVRELGRRLREAGLIGTGAGGRYGGADMTPRDAAGLLTALLIVRASSISLTKIMQHTEDHLRGLKSHRPSGHRMVPARWSKAVRLPELCRLKTGHSFGEAFTALIASFSTQDFQRAMKEFGTVDVAVRVISARPDPEVRIEFFIGKSGHMQLIYILPREAKRSEVVSPRKWSDIRDDLHFDMAVQANVGQATLKAIGLLLRDSEREHA